MKKIIASTLAAAGFFGAGLAQAVGADLSVRGKLQSGACSVVIGSQGSFDLGVLRASELNTDTPTWLGPSESELPLTINCRTASRIAVRLQDNRAGTHFDGSLTQSPSSDTVFGLGTAGGRRIGEYMAGIFINLGDGHPAELLVSAGPGAALPWWKAGSGAGFLNTGTHEISFTAAGGSEPAAFSSINGAVTVSVAINRGDELDLSQQIKIDGSATLELVYL